MSKRVSTSEPTYQARMATRRRLRAVVGWGVRIKDLTPEQRQEAEQRAAEPLPKASLDAVARGEAPKAGTFVEPIAPPPLALRFEARFRAALEKGEKTSTIRKKSASTARYKVGRSFQVEAPKGSALGVSEIVAFEEAPRLSPAERQALTKIYGARYTGPWVRLRFTPLAS